MKSSSSGSNCCCCSGGIDVQVLSRSCHLIICIGITIFVVGYFTVCRVCADVGMSLAPGLGVMRVKRMRNLQI